MHVQNYIRNRIGLSIAALAFALAGGLAKLKLQKQYEAHATHGMVAKRKGQNSFGATVGCDLYEIRPRKSGDGVDLISDRFRHGPIWYSGPDAVRNAVAYARYRSLSLSHQAKIRVLDDFGAVIQTH
jgi:hypothetical protein